MAPTKLYNDLRRKRNAIFRKFLCGIGNNIYISYKQSEQYYIIVYRRYAECQDRIFWLYSALARVKELFQQFRIVSICQRRKKSELELIARRKNDSTHKQSSIHRSKVDGVSSSFDLILGEKWRKKKMAISSVVRFCSKMAVDRQR